MAQQQIPYVYIKSGPNRGREGHVLEGYNGTWVHVRFEDNKKPKEAYLPPTSVGPAG